MDQYNPLRSQDLMTTNIYNFLDNLLAAVRTSETLASEAQERDQINVPENIKPGGYSEDIFIFLSEREKEEYSCSICYSVIKDVHQCSNGHKFCYSCIYVWSTCNRAGADSCPACRCDGIYARNEQLNEKIGSKRVKCQDDGCNWRGFLRDYNEHEHRHYDFKELSRSIELPSLKGTEIMSAVSQVSSLPLELIENEKATNDTFPINFEPLSTNDWGLHATTVLNSTRPNVSQTNSVPRRLSRLSDGNGVNVRTPAPRPNNNNYPRTINTVMRCPTYRQGINYLPRPPRVARINRPSEFGTQSENVNRLNSHESTQTYNVDVIERSDNTPILSSLLDSSRDTPTPFSRTPSSVRDVHSPLFPAINTTSRNNLATSDRHRMEYRRLAPTYASRRSHVRFTNDGREHLAMMLILLTSDLEDHPTLRSHSRNRLDTPVTGLTSLGASSEFTSQDRPTIQNDIGINSSRLQDFRNLNRRLSEVANSLDLLIESTSREGDRLASTTARSSSGSPTSDNASDTEE